MIVVVGTQVPTSYINFLDHNMITTTSLPYKNILYVLLFRQHGTYLGTNIPIILNLALSAWLDLKEKH